MSSPFVDKTYLQYQYGDSEKLKIRIETHQRYTVGDDDFHGVELSHIAAEPGMVVLDVGSGTGRLADTMRERGVRYVGLDASAGMVKEARQKTGGVFVQGDAQALPIPDAQFDRVVAFGVLYALPDWRQALRELRRVVRPGGRVVVSTNGADAMKRIYDVHCEAALELGHAPLPYGSPAFRIESVDDVRAVFPTVQCHVRDTALVFPDPEPALRFYATNRIDMVEGWERSTEHRARLLPLVRAKIEEIIRHEGSFRVPKTWGYFVADV